MSAELEEVAVGETPMRVLVQTQGQRIPPRPAKPAKAKSPGVKRGVVLSAAAPGSLLMQRAERLGNLDQPLNADKIASALGLSRKEASNLITQAKGKGWLKRMSPGQYQTTVAYPFKGKGEKPAAAAEIEVPEQMAVEGERRKITLEEQLSQACRERDRARERGNEKLEKIYQAKVDEIQKLLDGE